MDERGEIQWPGRVPKAKLRRLYRSDAQGLLDEELLDDVGTLLYQRCQAIFTVHEAKQGRVRCPRCQRQGRETIIPRRRDKTALDLPITCPACGWSITWREYQRAYKRRQLNLGGAADAFEEFLRRWPAARTPQAKMFAVDRLIHAFHYSLRQYPGLPTRPAGLNLIDGKLEDTIAFLNELSYGPDTQREWRQAVQKFRAEFLDGIGRPPPAEQDES